MTNLFVVHAQAWPGQILPEWLRKPPGAAASPRTSHFAGLMAKHVHMGRQGWLCWWLTKVTLAFIYPQKTEKLAPYWVTQAGAEQSLATMERTNPGPFIEHGLLPATDSSTLGICRHVCHVTTGTIHVPGLQDSEFVR